MKTLTKEGLRRLVRTEVRRLRLRESAGSAMEFEEWLDEVGRGLEEAGMDWDHPEPEIKAEYEEYKRDWQRGLTPEQEVQKILDEFPDDSY